ncbi:hypothetical protein NAL32_12640 [Chryseobacterium sp. Ch-15]|jgi:hypothetical protein|uniref:Addiction module component n=1 Tax=Chryseobacterium muglaense TaxID=2893752 RepID=A0A9Q3YTU7_9FLAO|nr:MULTISPECIES: hypothetical protein [Chryseobacterium]MBD3905367.1 hypothetical protein [Chryseobacterium muglaense]MBW3521106.1 hypothetical protein [Chryseobacterium sp. NKUCC03_KSP]MCC9036908.1 hypothetical protein [Chryseobacterium muglaense]MCD0455156.1 hypothetical protein [Chryseobacterium sp. LC2016-27]MCM2555230.1 hypothetical protein [Chryseobacterium muglaense]
MENLQVLRNRLIEKILTTKNVVFLEAIDKIFSSTQIEEKEIELSDVQMKMLRVAEEDIKYGRVISEEELDKLDEEWMK